MEDKHDNVSSYDFDGVLPKLKLPKKSSTKILMLVFVLLVLPLTVYLVGKRVNYRSRAAVDPASLYVLPSESAIPPDDTYKVMIDASNNLVGFARIEVRFDNSKLQLLDVPYLTIADNCKEANPTKSRLCTIIQSTTLNEANTTGKIVFVLGLTPADKESNLAPTGVFEFMSLNFESISVAPNDSTTLPFSSQTQSDGIQLVDLSSLEIPVSVSSSNISLNPVVDPTATPTNVPTSTPTLTPTPTSTPTPTPTLTPTATLTPTLTPVPTSITPTSGVSPTPSFIPGDADRDGDVDLIDYSILFSVFGLTPSDSGWLPWGPAADFNGDNVINLLDYGILFANFGTGS